MINKMKYLVTILICLLLVDCGTFSPKPRTPTPVDHLGRLKDKAALYTELMETNGHRDAHGFIGTKHCDATLFSGLLSAALRDVDLTVARNGKQWFRRPNQDCGSAWENSRSTISRDMMLGVFYHMWYTRDLDSAVALMDQLKSNAYFLEGQGTPGELFMIPTFMNTLAELILGLDGPRYSLELNLPAIFGKDTGYVAHLTVWHILLRGNILNKIHALDMDVLEFHALRSPLNPLFQAAYHKYLDGNMTYVVQLLLNSSEWPHDRLPTTKGHCDDWPISRDHTPGDWGPCRLDNPVEHSGAELVVLYHLLLKDQTIKEVRDGRHGPREAGSAP